MVPSRGRTLVEGNQFYGDPGHEDFLERVAYRWSLDTKMAKIDLVFAVSNAKRMVVSLPLLPSCQLRFP